MKAALNQTWPQINLKVNGLCHGMEYNENSGILLIRADTREATTVLGVELTIGQQKIYQGKLEVF